MQDEIVTPPHISRKAFYTIPLIGVTTIVSLIYDYKRLAFLSFCLMLTSFSHWNLLKKEGIEREIDRTMVVLTYTSLLFDAQSFCPEYRNWWYVSTAISLSVYATNQYIFYKVYESTTDPLVREKNNYGSTYIHMVFLHVLPNVSCIYGIMTSNSCA
jgi:hypothetical protein